MAICTGGDFKQGEEVMYDSETNVTGIKNKLEDVLLNTDITIEGKSMGVLVAIFDMLIIVSTQLEDIQTKPHDTGKKK